jgi:hypothetical protein
MERLGRVRVRMLTPVPHPIGNCETVPIISVGVEKLDQLAV